MNMIARAYRPSDRAAHAADHRSPNPVVVPEAHWVEGHVLHLASRAAHRLTVHRTRVRRRDPGLALGWGGADAYVARLNLTPLPVADIRQGQSLIQLPFRRAMQTTFMEVREPCEWTVAHPIDQVTFELPKVALASWAEDHAIDRTMLPGTLSGHTVLDPVLKAFGLAAASAIGDADKPDQFFVDHLFDGFCSYLLDRFGTRSHVNRGGLASWQERRAKEMMDACGARELSLSDLAAACGLSVAHFARAFRQSCGTTPHRWLMSRRIERAEALMKGTDMPLASIAIECGFVDQAHLTNLFTKQFGTPPGALRRRWRSEIEAIPA